jgi:hypothetical protein
VAAGFANPATAFLRAADVKRWLERLVAVAAIGVAGCATLPAGPSLNALPGSRKTFDQFTADDATCRQFALEQVGGKSPSEAANQTTAAGAVVGTALGAAAGAAIGGGSGAAVGAGFGLLTGSAVGAGYAGGTFNTVQQRYDGAYYQCMFAKGQKIPVSGSVARSARPPSQSPPVAAQGPYYPPPPPPNAPPPPPR